MGIVFAGSGVEEWQRERNGAEIWKAVNALRWFSHEYCDRDLDGNGVKDYWMADVSGLLRRLPPGLDPEIRQAAIEMGQADAKPLSLRREPPRPYFGYYIVAVSEDESGLPFGRDTDGSGRSVHHPDEFAFCMYPAVYGPKSRHTWIINRYGRFRRDNGGKPVLRWPSDDELKIHWGRS